MADEVDPFYEVETLADKHLPHDLFHKEDYLMIELERDGLFAEDDVWTDEAGADNLFYDFDVWADEFELDGLFNEDNGLTEEIIPNYYNYVFYFSYSVSWIFTKWGEY